MKGEMYLYFMNADCLNEHVKTNVINGSVLNLVNFQPVPELYMTNLI